MNKTNNYNELKSLAITKRTEFLNSEQYGTSLIKLLLQLLNLMENNIPLSEYHFYKPNIELFSLYQDYLILNEAKYQASGISMLKCSLENSLYASIEPNLLEIEIHELKPNKKESFLVLPLTVIFYDCSDNWLVHEVGCILRRTESFIHLEIIDTSHLAIPTRKQQLPETMATDDHFRQKKTIVNYCYSIPIENKTKLTKLLTLGLTKIENQFSEALLLKKNWDYSLAKKKQGLQENFFSKLSTLAIDEYYGDLVSTSQAFLGNCFAKQLDSTLRIVLGKKELSTTAKLNISPSLAGLQATYLTQAKLPSVRSTKDIYGILSAILLTRLQTLGFDSVVFGPLIEHIFHTYCFLKEERQHSSFKKKLQSCLANRYYQQTDLFLPKLHATHYHATENLLDPLHLESFRKKLFAQPINKNPPFFTTNTRKNNVASQGKTEKRNLAFNKER
ncbi:hypothetical protein IGK16_002288 [Enterococcus pernyi]